MVGNWHDPAGQFAHFSVADPANLERWDVGSRLDALKFEALAGMRLQTDSRTNWASLLVDGEALVTLNRPEPAAFAKQLSYLKAYANLRLDRSAEILAQVGDVLSFVSMPVSMNLQRHRWTLELLQAMVLPIITMEKAMKNALAARRPMEYSAQIQPMITTPAHGSFPSGHATESFALVEILAALIEAAKDGQGGPTAMYREQMRFQASRVAQNRVVAGVHFPVDNMAGALMGTALARLMIARATGVLKPMTGVQIKGDLDDYGDFNLDDLTAIFNGKPQGPFEALPEPVTPPAAPLLGHIWTLAKQEWS